MPSSLPPQLFTAARAAVERYVQVQQRKVSPHLPPLETSTTLFGISECLAAAGDSTRDARDLWALTAGAARSLEDPSYPFGTAYQAWFRTTDIFMAQAIDDVVARLSSPDVDVTGADLANTVTLISTAALAGAGGPFALLIQTYIERLRHDFGPAAVSAEVDCILADVSTVYHWPCNDEREEAARRAQAGHLLSQSSSLLTNPSDSEGAPQLLQLTEAVCLVLEAMAGNVSALSTMVHDLTLDCQWFIAGVTALVRPLASRFELATLLREYLQASAQRQSQGSVVGRWYTPFIVDIVAARTLPDIACAVDHLVHHIWHKHRRHDDEAEHFFLVLFAIHAVELTCPLELLPYAQAAAGITAHLHIAASFISSIQRYPSLWRVATTYAAWSAVLLDPRCVAHLIQSWVDHAVRRRRAISGHTAEVFQVASEQLVGASPLQRQRRLTLSAAAGPRVVSDLQLADKWARYDVAIDAALRAAANRIAAHNATLGHEGLATSIFVSLGDATVPLSSVQRILSSPLPTSAKRSPSSLADVERHLNDVLLIGGLVNTGVVSTDDLPTSGSVNSRGVCMAAAALRDVFDVRRALLTSLDATSSSSTPQVGYDELTTCLQRCIELTPAAPTSTTWPPNPPLHADLVALICDTAVLCAEQGRRHHGGDSIVDSIAASHLIHIVSSLPQSEEQEALLERSCNLLFDGPL